MSRANLFELVAENYIEHYPDDKNGWDFLWFFMNMEEDEIPFGSIIKETIIKKESRSIRLWEEKNTGYDRRFLYQKE